jgi:Transmembrane amino acid transporter protein
MALFGYAINGNFSPELITEIHPIFKDWLVFKILMNLAILFVVVNMIVSIPTLQLPARDQLVRSLNLNPKNILSYTSMTILMLLSSSFTAMVFTNIISVLSVVGGFTSCFILVYFPGFSNAVLHLRKGNKTRAYVIIAGTIFWAIVAFASCILGTLEQFGLVTLSV